MLVQIKDNVWVNNQTIQSLEINDYRDKIVVRLVDGTVHYVPTGYGKSIYATLDDLAAKINGSII